VSGVSVDSSRDGYNDAAAVVKLCSGLAWVRHREKAGVKIGGAPVRHPQGRLAALDLHVIPSESDETMNLA
jgi:hypothetical protein